MDQKNDEMLEGCEGTQSAWHRTHIEVQDEAKLAADDEAPEQVPSKPSISQVPVRHAA